MTPDRSNSWKHLAVVSFFAGCGFAFLLTAILGISHWYGSRPKPWNTKAIKATYDYIGTNEENNHIVFYYVLENMTDRDYRFETRTGIHLTGKLKNERSLSEAWETPTITIPLLLPARQRIRVAVEIPFSYPRRADLPKGYVEVEPPGRQGREEYRKKLREYVANEFVDLDGFVLFDDNNRYRIDFPPPSS